MTQSQIAFLAISLTFGAPSFAADSDVVSTGRGTFVVSAQAKYGWSTRGAQKTKAYERAHSFCMERGKEMKTISSKVSPSGQPAFAEIEFSCVATD